MSIRTILKYPDPELRRKAVPVEDFDEELTTLAVDMGETMYAAEGIGLAAPQVGVSRRLVVVDVSTSKEETRFMAVVNPVISAGLGEVTGEEGCLSVIDYSAKVRRFQKIRVTGQDLDGRPLDFEAEDRFARVIQHEVDHLEGTLFIDRISSLKRSLYKKKLKKILRDQE